MRPKAYIERPIIHHHEISVPKKVHRKPKQKKNLTQESYLQYFLATLCDSEWDTRPYFLGLRYQSTPEVELLLKRIQRLKLNRSDIASAHPNVLLSVLKGLVCDMPPMFPFEELLCINQTISKDLIKVFTTGLIDQLTSDARQTIYLLCKSLKKLISTSIDPHQALTDVIVIFTPLLFPSCNTPQNFIRAARICLLMIEDPHAVFSAYVFEDTCIWPDEQSTEIGVMQSDEEVFENVVQLSLSDAAFFYTITFED